MRRDKLSIKILIAYFVLVFIGILVYAKLENKFDYNGYNGEDYTSRDVYEIDIKGNSEIEVNGNASVLMTFKIYGNNVIVVDRAVYVEEAKAKMKVPSKDLRVYVEEGANANVKIKEGIDYLYVEVEKSKLELNIEQLDSLRIEAKSAQIVVKGKKIENLELNLDSSEVDMLGLEHIDRLTGSFDSLSVIKKAKSVNIDEAYQR